MFRSRIAIATISLVVCVSLGCAGWRSRIDPNTERFDDVAASAAGGEPKRLLLTLTVVHPGVEQQVQERRTQSLAEVGSSVLESSGYFSEVGPDVQDPDLELVLNLREQENFPKALAILCGLTLLVIPAVDYVETQGTGELFSSTGDKLASVKVDQEFTAVIGWLVLPAIPSYFITASRAQEDVFKSVLVQLADVEAAWR